MEMVVACFKVLFRLSLGNTDEQHTSVRLAGAPAGTRNGASWLQLHCLRRFSWFNDGLPKMEALYLDVRVRGSVTRRRRVPLPLSFCETHSVSYCSCALVPRGASESATASSAFHFMSFPYKVIRCHTFTQRPTAVSCPRHQLLSRFSLRCVLRTARSPAVQKPSFCNLKASHLSWNPKGCYRVCKNPHSSGPYPGTDGSSPQLHNIFLQDRPIFLPLLSCLISDFRPQFCVHFSVSHVLYMLLPSHSRWFCTLTTRGEELMFWSSGHLALPASYVGRGEAFVNWMAGWQEFPRNWSALSFFLLHIAVCFLFFSSKIYEGWSGF
jgi:hypothetical protein